MTKQKCVIKHCRNLEDIVYLGFPICWQHWFRHCEEDKNFDLKKELEIKESETNV